MPEYLLVLDEIPQSMGGKIAKSELRARVPDLLAGQRERYATSSPPSG